MSGTSRAAAFGAVFDRLKAILEPYGRRLQIVADDPKAYGVDMAPEAERDPTTWFRYGASFGTTASPGSGPAGP